MRLEDQTIPSLGSSVITGHTVLNVRHCPERSLHELRRSGNNVCCAHTAFVLHPPTQLCCVSHCGALELDLSTAAGCEMFAAVFVLCERYTFQPRFCFCTSYVALAIHPQLYSTFSFPTME